MGCFSFLCKTCGEPINSDSESGEHCRLYLLENGKVVEEMHGQYDSYGRVFDKDGESILWNRSWEDVCELMFRKDPEDQEDHSSGIAAIHSDCFCDMIPTTESEGDPQQGWGEYNHSMLDPHA